MKNLKTTTIVALAITLLVSCQEDEIAPKQQSLAANLMNQEVPKSGLLLKAGKTTQLVSTASGSRKLRLQIYKAEYLASGEDKKAGNTVFFNNRGNKQLDEDFAPALSLDGTTDITYHVDNTRPSDDLPLTTTNNAIDRAMRTWEGVRCSDLGITKIQSTGKSTGFVASLLGYRGSLDYVADINHAGWLPKSFFDEIAPDGGDFILAVTFTIIFTDENGNPVDIDNNKKADVAWREIYYNDAFRWNDGSTFDVETIALHESGHGLSQDHFGKAFLSGNGKLHFAPLAVMNAAYSGVQTAIGKTDLSGHCSNWASWPRK